MKSSLQARACEACGHSTLKVVLRGGIENEECGLCGTVQLTPILGAEGGWLRAVILDPAPVDPVESLNDANKQERMSVSVARVQTSEFQALTVPTVYSHIESLLRRSLGEKSEVAAKEAASELYHLARLAVQAVAELAEKDQRKLLDGVGENHLHSFAFYNGMKRHADVEAWLKLFKVGVKFRASRRKARSDANKVFERAVSHAYLKLHEWRNLAAPKKVSVAKVKSETEVKRELSKKLRSEPGEPQECRRWREAYWPAMKLRELAMRLPDPDRDGASFYCWREAVNYFLQRVKLDGEVDEIAGFRELALQPETGSWGRGMKERVDSVLQAMIE